MFGDDLEGQVIRPPAEAGSILLQVTLGCSHNKCAFCPAYKGKRFAIKPRERVLSALTHARDHLSDIRAHLPGVTRIASYANAKALARKSAAELAELRAAGLSTLYLGLESGSDEVLAAMNKWGDVAEHLRQAAKAREAGLKLSVTVLLGLAGADSAAALAHARATGHALSQMDPEQAAALALMVVPGTPLFAELEAGRFTPQTDAGLLLELRQLLEATTLSGGLFFSNHASNPLRLRLRLPREKQAGLDAIDEALAGAAPLVPRALRRL